MVLLGIVTAEILARLAKSRGEKNVDLRAHCVALGERDVEEKTEAETPAVGAGEEFSAGKDGRIVLDRLRPGTAKAGRPLCPTKFCD